MNQKLYEEAIRTFGWRSRFGKVQEEATELALAIIHFQQGKISLDQLADEMEGVRMTLDMLEIVLGPEACLRARNRQTARLRDAISATQGYR